MTDHADLSRRLALAIGWVEGDMVPVPRTLHLIEPEVVWILDDDKVWRIFDYRDPSVIWPIAERYDAFPVRLDATRWTAMYGKCGTFCYGDTAAEAVARAVIGARGC